MKKFKVAIRQKLRMQKRHMVCFLMGLFKAVEKTAAAKYPIFAERIAEVVLQNPVA